MSKRVAVATDAVSAGELFPYWRRYYGSQFGFDNLFVATYRNNAAFAGLPLGRVISVDADYSDTLRVALMGKMVRELLTRYDVVIRADVDEFLVPHPRRAASLKDYAQSLAHPYVTALGLNVIEIEHEPPLVLDGRPLLSQRRYCVATASLCKISIATRPLYLVSRLSLRRRAADLRRHVLVSFQVRRYRPAYGVVCPHEEPLRAGLERIRILFRCARKTDGVPESARGAAAARRRGRFELARVRRPISRLDQALPSREGSTHSPSTSTNSREKFRLRCATRCEEGATATAVVFSLSPRAG